ncbi:MULTISPECIES: poly-gamma-glutamate hydrolase family protein [Priestia]|nr:poly-gamma-glutamate hydrolase family protein [Priestia megaterium]PFL03300.1 hypothetical protein COJ01_03620 [Priestia megaterium]RCX24483.1 phage replication-related protein YjqB (UPF0714/DUF867 family) [Bacillus sp. AG236]USD14362.1 poly-gamma-glutamate hydrolase family protein [Priestia megaterium]
MKSYRLVSFSTLCICLFVLFISPFQDTSSASTDKYQNFKQLSQHESSASYKVTTKETKSPVLIFAPHGGGIEGGTSEIAKELSKQNALYLFESLKSKGSRDLHLTSTHFDEPTARKMVSKYDNVLSLHGYSGNEKHIFVGGTDRERAKKLTQLLNQNGFPAELITKGHDEIAGINPGNIANKNRTGKSIQLEISQPLRSAMFDSFTSKGRVSSKTQTFYKFTNLLSTFVSTSY